MTKTNSPDRVPLPWQRRIIAAWLLVVAAFVVATVVVGGATRLTESGLSITEWKPVTGVLPPFTQGQWQAEFEKYQRIPQYQQVNRGMSLDEFKTIFWWEWGHRLLGRTIGAVFLLPFLFFLWRGWVGAGLRWRLWTLFALGGAQGVVGWWMVYSGLSDRVSVSQYRLAFHMTLACVIYAMVLWTFLRLRADGVAAHASARLKAGAVALVALVLAQIYLGALVAGIDAGLVYNTWPLIDGAFVPAADRLWFLSPAWRNIFENHLTVQFIHRMVAYLLWIASLLHAWDALRARSAAAGSAMWLAIAVTVQAAIGILTLLHQVPFSLALTHQAAAIVILTIAVVHAGRLWPGTAREGFDARTALAR
jgi:cytochrome c oxidase assembly protein subunit 15